MTLEITFLAETNTTLPTLVRLLLGMNTFMPGQIVLHAETLAAYIARVFFLARVYCQVTQHLLSPAKSLGAIRALVRELVCMSFAVYVERSFGFECLATRVAHVWAFTGMDTSMIFHGGLHGEATAAYITSMILHPIVYVFQMII